VPSHGATPTDVTIGNARFNKVTVSFNTNVMPDSAAFDEVVVTVTAFFIATQAGNKVAWYVTHRRLPTCPL
jgi:hypothetical protein